MRKHILYLLIIISITDFVVYTRFVLADTVCQPPLVMAPDGNSCEPQGTYHLLTPLPCENGSNAGCLPDKNGNYTLQTYDPTEGNNFGAYLNLMIKLFIGICAVLAVIMIVIGGIEYMTSELISKKEEGKDRIRDAILGLILAIGAYTLLYTINPNLLNTDLKSLAIATVKVDLSLDNIPQTPTIVNGKAMYGGYAAGTSLATDFPQNSFPNLASNVQVCASNGQCGSGAQCTTVGQTNCTSTLGLNPSIVNSIASDCKCQVTITAGTEFWLHATNTDHHPGSPAVDISATSTMNSYITKSSTFPKDGSTYYDGTTCYYAEAAGATANTTANHWHVYPLPSSGTCKT